MVQRDHGKAAWIATVAKTVAEGFATHRPLPDPRCATDCAGIDRSLGSEPVSPVNQFATQVLHRFSREPDGSGGASVLGGRQGNVVSLSGVVRNRSVAARFGRGSQGWIGMVIWPF